MGKNHEKAIAERDKIREMAREIWPLLEEIEKKLEKFGVKGYTRVTISDDGYKDLEPGDSEWEVKKYKNDKGPKMVFDWNEELFLDDPEEGDTEAHGGTENE